MKPDKPKAKVQPKIEERIEVPEKEEEQSGSMIEEVEMGSGCVADMHKTSAPTPSQQELQLTDIINSKMLNKAKELFDIKKITVKAKN
jgi:DNA polymerase-3 subunit gamma/tau